MSCNCGCHDDKTPATGWRKFVPLIVGVVVVGALIAGAFLKGETKNKTANGSANTQATTAARP